MEQTQPISLRIGANFNQGKVRAENQDRIGRFHSPFGQVFIVADGMGGHEGGATAAQMLIDGLERHLVQVPPGTTMESALQAAASRANAEIYQHANSGDPKTAQMGATSVLALVRGNQVTIAHAGDSRAYLLRGGELSRLTRDHTVVQRMLDHNMLSPEEARDHPDASVVTRAFGQKPDVEMEISPPIELREGDRLLLCSDGLCGYVDDDRIHQVLARGGDAQAIADALIGLALDAGGEDNVSVQVLAAEGAAAPRVAAVPPPAPAPRRASSWIFIVLLLLAAFLLGAFLPWRGWISAGRSWLMGGKGRVETTPAAGTPKKQPKGRGTAARPGNRSETPANGGAAKNADRAVGGPSHERPAETEIEIHPAIVRSLLSRLGVAIRTAGDGFQEGRIYFHKDYEDVADEVLDELKRAVPKEPVYEKKLWPPELDKKMPDKDVVIVWRKAKGIQ